jgi:alpha-D-xyloside xylohydrolase
MSRFATITMLALLCAAGMATAEEKSMVERIQEGVWRVRLGVPDAVTPVSVRTAEPRWDGLSALGQCPESPFSTDQIAFDTSDRGCRVMLPCAERHPKVMPESAPPGKYESFFGFGLQFKCVNQSGLKRTMRVNADSPVNTGDSHAPVPFYVSTRGYGVYVDTARYASFYMDTHFAVGSREHRVMVDIPGAKGVDVYIFGGPTPREVVQRYVLFSGGGCLPPLWGLGVYYRGDGRNTAEESLALARGFRNAKIPCDVFGLEPGWHTNAYSCTYAWNPEKFPDSAGFIRDLTGMDFRLNLWEHAYVHPKSPIYDAMKPYAGDLEVWGGLVPDFSQPGARDVFGGYHKRELIEKGVTGFKLDECDNSDYIDSPWSFPELSKYPSGLDGERMHNLIGTLYQQTLYTPFREKGLRTYGQVRSSGALAAPLPYAIYSDLYEHKDYVRALINAGFTGLLWTPEVRSCSSEDELYRRLEVVVFSPQTMVNAWYIKNPPWKQFETEKNNRNEFLANTAEVEAACADILRWRVRLIPYLYAAFARYWQEGHPPFRGLMLDYPNDPNTYNIDDEYLMGESLLVAPLRYSSSIL